MSAVVETLEKARALVARGWRQHGYARNDRGESVCATDPEACAWCISGALIAANAGAWNEATHALKTAGAGVYIPKWNDAPGRTQVEVLAVFDRAIAIAKGDAK